MHPTNVNTRRANTAETYASGGRRWPLATEVGPREGRGPADGCLPKISCGRHADRPYCQVVVTPSLAVGMRQRRLARLERA